MYPFQLTFNALLKHWRSRFITNIFYRRYVFLESCRSATKSVV